MPVAAGQCPADNTCLAPQRHIQTANSICIQWHNVQLSGVVVLVLQLRGHSQADGETTLAGLCKR